MLWLFEQNSGQFDQSLPFEMIAGIGVSGGNSV